MVIRADFKLLLHGTDQQRASFFAPAWGAAFEPCQEVSEPELPLTAGKSVTTGTAAEVGWKVG
ncbi:hypothetical protein ACFWWM_03230 [Streptomyces sp. NPDC058682]|uniref:hypothetical protein n=1 Tax=unclassified Streptomyces TaxID=2593676 RepID=UPI002252F741|nr:hypothetical protein [Streptomyces sp. NBC_01214]MCX4803821.1 hypothetical protein [Streptomyces sp. NBC_01214]